MQHPVAFTRVPLAYFVTCGYGDTDCGGGSNPWETGSYDLALEMARIENFNVSRYTSVIPRQAYEVPIDVARQYFEHGAVLEGILASMNGTTGEILPRAWAASTCMRRPQGPIWEDSPPNMKDTPTRLALQRSCTLTSKT